MKIIEKEFPRATIKMAVLSDSTIEFLTETIIPEQFIVSDREHYKISAILNLQGLTDEELQAVRNTIVEEFSDRQSSLRKRGDWDSYDRISTQMSMITAVIDEEKNSRRMAI